MDIWIPVIFLCLSTTIGLVSLWQYNRRQLENARLSSQQTLVNCALLVSLINHLQQHRGMSSAWLSGDLSFQVRREEKARQIQEMFTALGDLARAEGMQVCPCLTPNDWALFRHQWRELVDKLPTLAVEQSIARHSHLISKLLEWLAAIGEARIEPLAVDQTMIGSARNFTHRLPLLTECLGQARAIGSSVAAQKSCPPVARVRLLFLISRAESLLEQAVAAHDVGSETLRAQQAIRQMISTVRTRMLFSSGVVVTSSEYFSLATDAIDRVFTWVHACEEETRRFMVGNKPEMRLHTC